MLHYPITGNSLLTQPALNGDNVTFERSKHIICTNAKLNSKAINPHLNQKTLNTD